jgi:hypothetical protein
MIRKTDSKEKNDSINSNENDHSDSYSLSSDKNESI